MAVWAEFVQPEVGSFVPPSVRGSLRPIGRRLLGLSVSLSVVPTVGSTVRATVGSSRAGRTVFAILLSLLLLVGHQKRIRLRTRSFLYTDEKIFVLPVCSLVRSFVSNLSRFVSRLSLDGRKLEAFILDSWTSTKLSMLFRVR